MGKYRCFYNDVYSNNTHFLNLKFVVVVSRLFLLLFLKLMDVMIIINLRFVGTEIVYYSVCDSYL